MSLMFWQLESTSIKSIDMELPPKVKSIIQDIKAYAQIEEDLWYESLGDTYWLVKNATEEFTIYGKNYVLYPEAVCKTQAFFEHMMINKFEKELLARGATYVNCTGMID